MAYDGHGWVFWTLGEETHSTVTYCCAAGSGQAHKDIFARHKLTHNFQLLRFQTIVAKLLSGRNDTPCSRALALVLLSALLCHDYNYHVIRLSSCDSWYLIGSAKIPAEHTKTYSESPDLPFISFLPRFLPRPFNIIRWKVWPARLVVNCEHSEVHWKAYIHHLLCVSTKSVHKCKTVTHNFKKYSWGLWQSIAELCYSKVTNNCDATKFYISVNGECLKMHPVACCSL